MTIGEERLKLAMPVGIGFDSHPLKEGRKLFLGGVEIPYPKGLVGHSDGDVVIHSIIDALLGAMNKKDIGFWFPDTDPRYKDIPSILLLSEVRRIVAREGFEVKNIDTVVVCAAPKISPYREAMQEKIAQALGIEKDLVSIKGKRGEGFIQGEVIVSYSVVSLEET